MKKLAWKVALGIAGTAALGATTACTVTTGNSIPDGSVFFFDDGGTDAPTVGNDTGAADAGAPTSDAPSDGPIVCEVPDGSSTCDTCLLQNCCAAEDACASGPLDDAGNADCEDIASCFNDCRHPPVDSGVAPDTIANCTATCSASHTAKGTADFQALATCGTTHCSTQCQ